MKTRKLILIALILSLYPVGVHALNLEEAIDIALKKNRQIEAQIKGIEAAKYGMKASKSPYYPQLSINAGYTYFDPEKVITIPGGGSVQMGFHNNYTIGAGLNQVIFDWGRTPGLVGQKKAALDMESEKLRSLKNSVIFGVREVFYRINYLKENIENFKEALKTSLENFRVSKMKFDKGQASRYQMLRAEVEMENIKPNIISAENSLAVAYKDLAILIGGDAQTITGDLLFDFPLVDKKEALNKAVSDNTDMRVLELQMRSLKKQLTIDNSYNKPQLSGFASYDYQNPFNNETKWDGILSAGVKLTFPFFDGLKTYSMKKADKFSIEKIEVQQKDLEDNLAKEIERLYLDYIQAKELIVSQEANIREAKLGLDIARTRYNEGVSTQVELLDAQNALLRAKVNLNMARYDLARSFYMLQMVQGGPYYKAND